MSKIEKKDKAPTVDVDKPKPETAAAAPVAVGKVEEISFDVYAMRKKIPKYLHVGMRAYPKSKGVKQTSMEKWEEIFKDF